MSDEREHSVTLVAPPDDVDTVHDLLEEVWQDHPGITALDRASFETALVELAANVIRHADGGDGVRCDVVISVDGDMIVAELRDTGKGGSIDLVGAAMPDGLAEEGRGIPIIRALVDDVSYESTATFNRWRITRTLES